MHKEKEVVPGLTEKQYKWIRENIEILETHRVASAPMVYTEPRFDENKNKVIMTGSAILVSVEHISKLPTEVICTNCNTVIHNSTEPYFDVVVNHVKNFHQI